MFKKNSCEISIGFVLFILEFPRGARKVYPHPSRNELLEVGTPSPIPQYGKLWKVSMGVALLLLMLLLLSLLVNSLVNY